MVQARVLVVDDSAAFRTVLASCVDASGCARVIAHAKDGRDALAKVAEFKPDIITLDLEMPVLDGLATLAELRVLAPKTPVVMVSSHTRHGALATLRALDQGAVDFVTKPDSGDGANNREKLTQQVHAILRALTQAKGDAAPEGPSSGRFRAAPVASATPVRSYSTAPEPPATSNAPSAAGRAPVRTVVDSVPRVAAAARPRVAPQLIAIGSSTGGPVALAQLIPRLPANFPVPIAIVQHMPPLFTASLAESLASKSAVRVVEAQNAMVPKAGHVYIAPGGKHLRVATLGAAERHFELTEDPPENYCRPAVDYLFRSVAALYGERALGVILTGMGKDGTEGLRAMKRFGVRVLGQNAESCTIYGMPREAKAAGLVDQELTPAQIATELAATFGLTA